MRHRTLLCLAIGALATTAPLPARADGRDGEPRGGSPNPSGGRDGEPRRGSPNPSGGRDGEPRRGSPNPSGSPEDASQRFKAGVAFYKDKDFAAALVEFKRAYELLPNYNVLYNLGQTARELKDYAAALTAFERYLREGGAKIPPARRKEVSLAIDELRRKVGKLKVSVSVDGAEIVVDDVRVGVSPLAEPVVVNAGRRKLEASRAGYVPAQRIVDVASTEETSVSLDLAKIGASPPKAEPVPPPAAKVPPLVGWGVLAGTGAFVVAAGVTGGLALSAHGSLKTALATFPGDAATITAAQGKTRTFSVATDALGGIAVAGAVTTAVLFLVVPRLSVQTTVVVSPVGVVVGHTF